MKLGRGRDETGNVYGYLTVLSLHSKSENGTCVWLCRCHCGVEKPIRSTVLRLKHGGTISCGCMRGKETKHGLHNSPTYRSWRAMKARCGNDKSTAFDRYGGRGIAYCAQWESFEGFLADMGERPEGTSLDRIDVNGNYEPSNCRWATSKEQANNRRNNRSRKSEVA